MCVSALERCVLEPKASLSHTRLAGWISPGKCGFVGSRAGLTCSAASGVRSAKVTPPSAYKPMGASEPSAPPVRTVRRSVFVPLRNCSALVAVTMLVRRAPFSYAW